MPACPLAWRRGPLRAAAGVMSVRGRQDRLDFTATFGTAYHFRLLYKGVSMHPIMGALRHEHDGPWEVGRGGARAECGWGGVDGMPRAVCGLA